MEATWHGEAARREETVRLGLWMFLATVAMLFAAFGSAYLVRRSGSDWAPVALPRLLVWNTLVLAGSSLALEAAAWSGRRRHWTASRAGFAVAVLGGAAFLAGQLFAWRTLLAGGVGLPASPHGAFFYMLTATHAVHVVAALAVLAYAATLTWARADRLDPRRWHTVAGLARSFWHFLLGVWLFVYALLSAA